MKKTGIYLLLIVVAFWAGGRFGGSGGDGISQTAATATDVKAEIWTCSMHPQVRLPEPGKCPICGMDLILATGGDDDDDANPRELRMSRASAALAEIETAPARRRAVELEVRMVGKIEFDESQVTYITAWVGGRMDRLFVDYTGVPVRQGDHMVDLYSPELLTAQEDLLQALRTSRERPEGRFVSGDIVASRERLVRLGLTTGQVGEIEARGKGLDTLTIVAPASGIVVHKNGLEGMWVKEGSRIYTIADLSQLWIKFDAYESDLRWLRLGQQVEFSSEAYPSENFLGRIAFIDPVLDEKTRSVKVRANVSNEDGRLKPGMYARGRVLVELAEGGLIQNTFLQGKWVCPMHPDNVRDGAGLCDVCSMPLVTAKSLGYVDDAGETGPPLVIPATAPLLTGTRAVVYVMTKDGDQPVFEGRVVQLGARAGNSYVVQSGLAEGERVVVKGNFKIDSELQIRAKPSMMSVAEEDPEAGAGITQTIEALEGLSEEFLNQLTAVVESYLDVTKQLAQDNPEAVGLALANLSESLTRVDMSLLEGAAHLRWMEDLQEMNAGVTAALSTEHDIEAQRKGLLMLSDSLAKLIARYRPVSRADLHKFHCPMAFNNQGANWYQRGTDVANPYFGQAMLGCGEEVVEPVADKAVKQAVPITVPPDEFREQLGLAVSAYLDISDRLASDDIGGALQFGQQMRVALTRVDLSLLSTEAHDAWMSDQKNLEAGLASFKTGEGEIEVLRAGLLLLSQSLPPIISRYQPSVEGGLHQFFCPMAFNDKGGTWYQRGEQIANPYFGAAMLRCGTKVEKQ